MSNQSLELWKKSIIEYYGAGNYKIPKKGTSDYIAIKKIYEAKKSASLGKKGKNAKSCKCPK